MHSSRNILRISSSTPRTIIPTKRRRRTTRRTSVHGHVSRGQVTGTVSGRTVGRVPSVRGRRSVSRWVVGHRFALSFSFTFTRRITTIARQTAASPTPIREIGRTARKRSWGRCSYSHHLLGFTTTFKFGHPDLEIHQFSVQHG